MAGEFEPMGHISLDGFQIDPGALTINAPAPDPLEALVEAKRKLDAVRRTVFVHADLVEELRAKVEEEGLAGIVAVRPLPEGMPADKGYIARDFNYRGGPE